MFFDDEGVDVMFQLINQILTVHKNKKVEVTVCCLEEWGLCDWEDGTLYIRKSLSLENQIRALIHETTHYLFPELSEESVYMIECDVYRHLRESEKVILVQTIQTAQM